jgi:hypothetical protein
VVGLDGEDLFLEVLVLLRQLFEFRLCLLGLGGRLFQSSLALHQFPRVLLGVGLAALGLPVQSCVFFRQQSLLLVDLLEYHLAEIPSQFLRPSLVELDHLRDLVGELRAESVVLVDDLFVLLLEGGELLVDGLEPALDVLDGLLVLVEEGEEGAFEAVQDGVGVDGGVEVRVLLPRLQVELRVQVPELAPESIA